MVVGCWVVGWLFATWLPCTLHAHAPASCEAPYHPNLQHNLHCELPSTPRFVGAGVTIAATGGKDRTVRLWGLAPLVPSPVQKPQIATLRGHGAPVTCLAMAGGSSCWGSSWGSSWDGGGWDGGSTSTAGRGTGQRP